MKLKKGDTVRMLSGKDRGKTGKILRAIPKTEKVVVEGLQLAIRHQRPRREGEKGQRIQFPRAVPAGKVMFLCPKCGALTRLGAHIVASGKKARICKKCKAEV